MKTSFFKSMVWYSCLGMLGCGGGSSVPQTWSKTYTGIYDGIGVVQPLSGTSDGGWIIGGITGEPGVFPSVALEGTTIAHIISGYPADAWLAKFRSDGSIDWQKKFQRGEGDNIYEVQEISGGYIVLGNTQSIGERGNVWLMKIDKNGNPIWQNIYGGPDHEEITSIAQSQDGGFAVSGSYYYDETASFDGWVMKVGSTGNIEWQRSYGTPSSDTAIAIYSRADGGYILGGRSQNIIDEVYEYWMLNIAADGEIESQWNFQGSFNDSLQFFRPTQDGGNILIGHRIVNSVISSAWVTKLSSDGSVEWRNVYEHPQGARFNSVIENEGGEFILIGNSADQGLIAKLDAAGSILWQFRYGKVGFAYLLGIQEGVIGYTVNGLADNDLWTMRVDEDGGVAACSEGFVAVSDITVRSEGVSSLPSGIVAGGSGFTQAVVDVGVEEFGIELAGECSRE